MHTFEYEVTQYTSNGRLDTTTGASEIKLVKGTVIFTLLSYFFDSNDTYIHTYQLY